MDADLHHKSSVAALRTSTKEGRRLATTWEVVSEAYTLVRMRIAQPKSARRALTVLRWARESGILILASTVQDHDRAGELLEAHSSLRLSYVDALLLAVAERSMAEEVITVDGGHFQAVHLITHPAVTVV